MVCWQWGGMDERDDGEGGNDDNEGDGEDRNARK
jgi:hypothetical protein